MLLFDAPDGSAEGQFGGADGILFNRRIGIPDNSFTSGSNCAILQEGAQIVFEVRSGLIALFEIGRERLGNNRRKRTRTILRQRTRRAARLNEVLQLARVLRLVRRVAREHFIQGDSQSP